MSPWLIWLLIAFAFAILEMFTTGFMVIWLGVSALVSMVVSLIFPEAFAVQVVVFGILSIVLVLFTKKFADKVTSNAVPTNVYSVIGKKANVIVEINGFIVENHIKQRGS